MLDPGLVRAGGLGVPALAVALAVAWRRPRGRDAAAVVLAVLWILPPLVVLNWIAPDAGWWRFDAAGGTVHGLPVDLWVGWGLLWGALPALLVPRTSPVWVALGLLALDLGLMPLCRPVVRLDGEWLLGEALAIAGALLPGLALARWTRDGTHVAGRALLQAAAYFGWLLVVLPDAILASIDATWVPLLDQRAETLGVAAQVLFVVAVPGLAACQEFAVRGGGTAVPFDPPLRLVTSGPYAYLRNPMQVSTVLLLLGIGVLVDAWPVMAAAAMAVVFGVGFASWHEDAVLRERFGAPWETWTAHVRAWLPRWRPWVPYEATLYVALGCGPCEAVGRWVAARGPVGLRIAAAQDHPSRDLDRIAYDPGDGGPEEDGVAALARAMEHVHLGWALAGWTLRLPGVHAFVQALVDVCGGGPRLVKRRASSGP